jgi:signal transduction histidine kinase/DNA-binding response OmpR family regulator
LFSAKFLVLTLAASLFLAILPQLVIVSGLAALPGLFPTGHGAIDRAGAFGLFTTASLLVGMWWSQRKTPRKSGADSLGPEALAALAKSGQLAVAVTETDGRLHWTSSGFAGMIGAAAGALVGRPLAELVTEPAELRRHLASHQAFTVSVSLAGQNRWLDLEAQPVPGADGAAGSYVILAHDVTAQRKSEEEIRQAYAALEDLNNQLETAIARANALAVEAAVTDQAKSAFLATMSHEIRTPLNGVIGMTHILENSPLNDEQRECLRTIKVSGAAVLAVINDILDYSKIESGRLELEKIEFDLASCLEEVVDLVAHRAFAKKLELAFVLKDEVPQIIVGDQIRLRQVLLNLAGNAVKFTAQGEIVLEARVEQRQGDRCTLLFSVRDTGIGIPKEKQELLFQSYAQMEASTTRTYGGTGLGLSISKKLAELMGGRMWVESDAGRGSTFFFTIEATAIDLERSAGFVPPEVAGKRLLIVEHNATNQSLLRRYASKWGMQPTLVGAAEAALALLRAGETFDLVLLAEDLPDADGFAFAQMLAEEKLDGGPVILYSRLSGRTKGPGVNLVLQKPVKPGSLLRAFRQVLRPAIDLSDAFPKGPSLVETAARMPLRILMAEGNDVNQKVAQMMLARLGYQADVVANGAEALAAMRQTPYDVVLMETQLAVVDGLEVARKIRAERGPRCPPWIVAITTAAFTSERSAAFAAGLNDFLTKPVIFDQLQQALVRGFHEVQATRAAGKQK